MNSTTYTGKNGIHTVPVWRIIGFSGVNLAVNLFFGLTFIMSYYLNGFVGMAVIFASMFSTVMRLWDGVTDPIIGFIVDKFGKKGKARFCMTVGIILLYINSFLMFNVTHRLPESGIVRSVFFTVFALLFYVGYTFLNVSMHVGNVCLTNAPKQRSLYSIAGTVLVRMSRAVMGVVTAVLIAKYGKMSDIGVFREYWMVAANAALVFTAIGYISIAPKDTPEFNTISEGSTKKLKFSDYFKVFKENRPLRMMIVAEATDKLAASCMISAVTIVVFGIIIGNYSLNGGWGMYTTIIGLIMMAIGVGAIGGNLGFKKAMVFGSWGTAILYSLAILLFILGDPKSMNLPGYVNGYGEAFDGFNFFTVALFLITVTGGGCQMIISSIIVPMIAEINDYEASRSGVYRPGMVGTMVTFIDKLISSAAPTLVGLVFALIGFKDKFPDVDTPYSLKLFIVGMFFFYGLTVLGAVCNIIAMKFYDLTPEKMAEVRVKVAQLRNQG